MLRSSQSRRRSSIPRLSSSSKSGGNGRESDGLSTTFRGTTDRRSNHHRSGSSSHLRTKDIFRPHHHHKLNNSKHHPDILEADDESTIPATNTTTKQDGNGATLKKKKGIFGGFVRTISKVVKGKGSSLAGSSNSSSSNTNKGKNNNNNRSSSSIGRSGASGGSGAGVATSVGGTLRTTNNKSAIGSGGGSKMSSPQVSSNKFTNLLSSSSPWDTGGGGGGGGEGENYSSLSYDEYGVLSNLASQVYPPALLMSNHHSTTPNHSPTNDANHSAASPSSLGVVSQVLHEEDSIDDLILHPVQSNIEEPMAEPEEEEGREQVEPQQQQVVSSTTTTTTVLNKEASISGTGKATESTSANHHKKKEQQQQQQQVHCTFSTTSSGPVDLDVTILSDCCPSSPLDDLDDILVLPCHNNKYDDSFFDPEEERRAEFLLDDLLANDDDDYDLDDNPAEEDDVKDISFPLLSESSKRTAEQKTKNYDDEGGLLEKELEMYEDKESLTSIDDYQSTMEELEDDDEDSLHSDPSLIIMGKNTITTTSTDASSKSSVGEEGSPSSPLNPVNRSSTSSPPPVPDTVSLVPSANADISGRKTSSFSYDFTSISTPSAAGDINPEECSVNCQSADPTQFPLLSSSSKSTANEESPKADCNKSITTSPSDILRASARISSSFSSSSSSPSPSTSAVTDNDASVISVSTSASTAIIANKIATNLLYASKDRTSKLPLSPYEPDTPSPTADNTKTSDSSSSSIKSSILLITSPHHHATNKNKNKEANTSDVESAKITPDASRVGGSQNDASTLQSSSRIGSSKNSSSSSSSSSRHRSLTPDRRSGSRSFSEKITSVTSRRERSLPPPSSQARTKRMLDSFLSKPPLQHTPSLSTGNNLGTRDDDASSCLFGAKLLDETRSVSSSVAGNVMDDDDHGEARLVFSIPKYQRETSPSEHLTTNVTSTDTADSFCSNARNGDDGEETFGSDKATKASNEQQDLLISAEKGNKLNASSSEVETKGSTLCRAAQNSPSGVRKRLVKKYLGRTSFLDGGLAETFSGKSSIARKADKVHLSLDNSDSHLGKSAGAWLSFEAATSPVELDEGERPSIQLTRALEKHNLTRSLPPINSSPSSGTNTSMESTSLKEKRLLVRQQQEYLRFMLKQARSNNSSWTSSSCSGDASIVSPEKVTLSLSQSPPTTKAAAIEEESPLQEKIADSSSNPSDEESSSHEEELKPDDGGNVSISSEESTHEPVVLFPAHAAGSECTTELGATDNSCEREAAEDPPGTSFSIDANAKEDAEGILGSELVTSQAPQKEETSSESEEEPAPEKSCQEKSVDAVCHWASFVGGEDEIELEIKEATLSEDRSNDGSFASPSKHERPANPTKLCKTAEGGPQGSSVTNGNDESSSFHARAENTTCTTCTASVGSPSDSEHSSFSPIPSTRVVHHQDPTGLSVSYELEPEDTSHSDYDENNTSTESEESYSTVGLLQHDFCQKHIAEHTVLPKRKSALKLPGRSGKRQSSPCIHSVSFVSLGSNTSIDLPDNSSSPSSAVDKSPLLKSALVRDGKSCSRRNLSVSFNLEPEGGDDNDDLASVPCEEASFINDVNESLADCFGNISAIDIRPEQNSMFAEDIVSANISMTQMLEGIVTKSASTDEVATGNLSKSHSQTAESSVCLNTLSSDHSASFVHMSESPTYANTSTTSTTLAVMQFDSEESIEGDDDKVPLLGKSGDDLSADNSNKKSSAVFRHKGSNLWKRSKQEPIVVETVGSNDQTLETIEVEEVVQPLLAVDQNASDTPPPQQQHEGKSNPEKTDLSTVISSNSDEIVPMSQGNIFGDVAEILLETFSPQAWNGLPNLLGGCRDGTIPSTPFMSSNATRKKNSMDGLAEMPSVECTLEGALEAKENSLTSSSPSEPPAKVAAEEDREGISADGVRYAWI